MWHRSAQTRTHRTALGALSATLLLIACFGIVAQQEEAPAPPTEGKTIRCAVIGGMYRTGLWEDVGKLFEEETGYKVIVAVTGQRPKLAEAFKRGEADILTMHSGDITTNLVADGYGINMRPWARNDLVIAGPPSDPAGIRGMTDAVGALRKIAEAKANFVDTKGIGPREVGHALWNAAGISPEGDWLLQDESGNHLNILHFAEEHNAYVIVGRSPMVQGKIPAGNMEVMVDQAPEMRRPYIVMEANPAKIPQANSEGAHLLANFLLSERVQQLLEENGTDKYGGFHRVEPTDVPE